MSPIAFTYFILLKSFKQGVLTKEVLCAENTVTNEKYHLTYIKIIQSICTYPPISSRTSKPLAYEQSCLFSFTMSFMSLFIAAWKSHFFSWFWTTLKNCLKLHYKRHCERYWERQKASFAKMWHTVHPGIGLFTIMICNIAERQMSTIFCYGTIQTDFLLTYTEWA